MKNKSRLIEHCKAMLEMLGDPRAAGNESAKWNAELFRHALGSLTAEPGIIAENLQHLDWSGVSDHHRAIINSAVEMLSRPPTPPAASRVPDIWMSTKEQIPEECNCPYQVLAVCKKRYTDGVYAGHRMKRVVQDWVVRQWPDNFVYWMHIPNAPTL